MKSQLKPFANSSFSFDDDQADDFVRIYLKAKSHTSILTGEPVKPQKQKSIVIEHGLRKTVVAAGTVFIEQYPDQVVANIGELMVSKTYGEPNELIKQMLSCLEGIAWYNNCS